MIKAIHNLPRSYCMTHTPNDSSGAWSFVCVYKCLQYVEFSLIQQKICPKTDKFLWILNRLIEVEFRLWVPKFGIGHSRFKTFHSSTSTSLKVEFFWIYKTLKDHLWPVSFSWHPFALDLSIHNKATSMKSQVKVPLNLSKSF